MSDLAMVYNHVTLSLLVLMDFVIFSVHLKMNLWRLIESDNALHF